MASSSKNKFKGPKKYNHGTDSQFVLSALDTNGNWKSIFSRSRPDSRSNKVFSEEAQILHLQKGFSNKEKGFELFNGDYRFAYIGLNMPGQNWQTALYHWIPATEWKTGAATALPSRPGISSWKFGSTGSTLFLHVRTSSGWLPKIWGWDRPYEQSPVLFSIEEQIARLKVQFESGGHDGNRFMLNTVEQAHIAYREGGNVKNAICYWIPVQGWCEGAKSFESSGNSELLPQMSGRLWLAGPEIKSRTIYPCNDIRRKFAAFSTKFAEVWPTVLDRYADTETGEIPEMVIEAFFWATEAVLQKRNNSRIIFGRIYFTDRQDFLLARLDTGQIYCPKVLSWPSKSYFTLPAKSENPVLVPEHQQYKRAI